MKTNLSNFFMRIKIPCVDFVGNCMMMFGINLSRKHTEIIDIIRDRSTVNKHNVFIEN